MPLSFKKYSSLLPGLILSLTVAFFSIFFVDLLNIFFQNLTVRSISPISIALVFGILFSKLARNNLSFQPGLTFTFKNLLRIATVLLGFRLSLHEVYKIGLDGLAYIAITIISLFLLNSFLSRYISISKSLSTLITMGTAICGMSAIMATASVINAKKEETTTAVAIISLFGFLSLITYPFVANFVFPHNEWAAGVFLGIAIHDTAQVLGASLLYEQIYQAVSVLDVAVVIKLIRNLCLVFALPAIAYFHHKANREESKKTLTLKTLIPGFIYFFIAGVLIRSLGDMNESLAFGFIPVQKWWSFLQAIDHTATFFLTASTAAIGLESNIFSVEKSNFKAFGLGFSTAVAAGLITAASLLIAGH